MFLPAITLPNPSRKGADRVNRRFRIDLTLKTREGGDYSPGSTSPFTGETLSLYYRRKREFRENYTPFHLAVVFERHNSSRES